MRSSASFVAALLLAGPGPGAAQIEDLEFEPVYPLAVTPEPPVTPGPAVVIPGCVPGIADPLCPSRAALRIDPNVTIGQLDPNVTTGQLDPNVWAPAPADRDAEVWAPLPPEKPAASL